MYLQLAREFTDSRDLTERLLTLYRVELPTDNAIALSALLQKHLPTQAAHSS